ncbi:MAG: deoxyguanosinetriphosphate triphosphohydrolase [Desulfobacterales bacterium]|nr:deoxyguanosinetriphosphate triphosphohydrolase [Desulfobacterales bacterium]
MICREQYESREKQFLSPFACLSSTTRGRQREEVPCPIRTSFQVDRDRIIYSSGFRRLKHKTQVFLSPSGDHYRTRLTHTLEVAEIARTIARGLTLNEDLAEAIALGHDLGHTPFGHSGETALQEVFSPAFCHNEQSLRMVDVLDNNANGLNLTYEVRDGILKHSKGFGNIIPKYPHETACTIEGQVVRIADIMAYLNHDLDDAIRSRVICMDQVPRMCLDVLGRTHSERANIMIKDLIYSSTVSCTTISLSLSEPIIEAMYLLRQFLYDNVYRSYPVHREFLKAKRLLIELYNYFLNNENELITQFGRLEIRNPEYLHQSKDRIVCDFIASMTDRYALTLYSQVFYPTPLV